MAVQWLAIHRHDIATNDCATWQSFHSLLHGGFRIATRILQNCRTAHTRVWTYTFPAALYDTNTGAARAWVDYGNPFEDYSLQDLPLLRNGTGNPIVDYPGTGKRYWVDMRRVDIESVSHSLIAKLNALLQRRIADDSALLQLLSAFGSGSDSYDFNSDGVLDDADLLHLLMGFGEAVLTTPAGFDHLFDGYFIDNAPEYFTYAQRGGLTVQQAIEGYERFVSLLKRVSPQARIQANVYEGALLDQSWARDWLNSVDVVFFENWRWFWASGTPLASGTVRAIETRIDRVVSWGKGIALGVPHALDSVDAGQKVQAIKEAVSWWGDGTLFGEFRAGFYRGRESGYPKPLREVLSNEA
jgi:hypothetical protein